MSISKALRVLQESVIRYLESGVKGIKVPFFHVYLDGPDDLEKEKIPELKRDVDQVRKALIEGMALVEKEVEVMVPVHETDYSPLLGVPVEKDAKVVIKSLLDGLLDQCELAIIADCGFGKFSASQEKIEEAQEQLKNNIETIYLPLSLGVVELKIIAYDSNNNLKQGRVADGMWVPFRAIGLVKFEDKVFAFAATMDYGSGNWGLDELGIESLYHLAEESSLFNAAYKKLMGEEFNKEKILPINLAFVNFLKASPHFQQELNRVCSRWREI